MDKNKGSGGINVKAVIAIVVAIAVIVAGVVIAMKFIPEKQTDEHDTVTSTEEITVSQSVSETAVVAQASEELVAKAVKAYEEELAWCEDYFSAYVTDINKDGIPELICRPGEMGMQFAFTYTEKNGLSQIDLMGHSSITPEVYISEDNFFYMRDDGHNQGTAFYHYAIAYKVDETGFVKLGEVEGGDPEDFDWEDEAVFNEMDAKYEGIFEENLQTLIGGKEFVAYSEVANEDDPVAYLNRVLFERDNLQTSAETVETITSDYRFDETNIASETKTEPVTETESTSNLSATHNEEYLIAIPESVVGWDVEMATAIIEAVGLEVDDEIIYINSTEDYGTVTGTIPEVGNKVAQQSEVRLVVSKGSQ